MDQPTSTLLLTCKGLTEKKKSLGTPVRISYEDGTFVFQPRFIDFGDISADEPRASQTDCLIEELLLTESRCIEL